MALNDNILAYWNFNDNGSGGASLTDDTGLGNTLAVVQGTAGSAEGVDGGLSFLLDGANVLQPASGEGAFQFGYGDFSVNFWIYPTSAQDGNQVYLAWGIWPYENGFHLNYGFDFISAFLGGFNEPITYTAGSSILDAWHQVTITRESGTASLYVNGVIVGTGAWNYDFNQGLYYIGRPQDTSAFAANGRLDLLGVWSRALSGAEITRLYNSENGLTYPFDALYFSGGNLSSLSNWWEDNGFTIPAASLPDSSSFVYLTEDVTSGSLVCESAYISNASNAGSITGNCRFIGNASNSGSVAGNCTFNGTASNSGSITGNCTFKGTSSNSGSITGNAYVYYPAQNPLGGSVSGTISYAWPNGTGIWGGDVWVNGESVVVIPAESEVQAGVVYGFPNAPLMGTLSAETPIPQEWDNYAYYGQGAVVALNGSLWQLVSTGGWTVGGRPDLGYGWQQLSLSSGGGGSQSGINLSQLIGLPPFIQL
jgi:hypothetical protein